MDAVEATTAGASEDSPRHLSPDRADRATTRRSLPNIATVGRVVSSFQRRGRHNSSFWKNRRDDNLKWFKRWDHQCFAQGRVMLVDYISNEAIRNAGRDGSSGHPHLAVAAQEFDRLEELESFYSNPSHADQAALRVIHVQNASWAHPFLLKQFNIDNDSDLVGMKDFSRWTKYERPRLRNNKPYPSGRSWPVQADPWRNISRTAIGVDYIRSKEASHTVPRLDRPGAQVLHLDAAEDSGFSHGHEVILARFAVYVQRKHGPLNDVSPNDSFKVPYVRSDYPTNGKPGTYSNKWKDKRVELEKLDNSNTIIIFEDTNTTSSQYQDCLIGARRGLENKWRRLSFYLKKQQASDDARLAEECSNIILGDIFHALAGVWEDLLGYASEHIALLEDRIYEDPSDESRAPDLWTNQAAWLKVNKVMSLHIDIIAELQGHLTEMSEDEERREPWLGTNTREFQRLAHSIEEDLIQPTNNLIDLMYKSVGIRDSKQSLLLGSSMWRLSWITFIFLPLTALAGFFSMQVDVFTDQSISLGWYFLAVGITMIIVVFLWYYFKSSLQTRRQITYQRGLYEQLYDEVVQDYPRLWNARGPATNIEPQGTVRKMKWHLLRSWFDPKHTIKKRGHDWTADDEAGFGLWAKLKRHLLRRWLGQIDNHTIDIEAVPLTASTRRNSSESITGKSSGVVVELAQLTAPVLVAEADPELVFTASSPVIRPVSRGRDRTSASPRNSSGGRDSSQASAALMVERRDFSDLESDIEEADERPADEVEMPTIGRAKTRRFRL